MPNAPITKNIRDGVLKIQDGDSNEIEVKLVDSGLSFTTHDNKVHVLDRGVLDHMRPGDEQAVDVNLNLKFTQFISHDDGEDVTPYEAITNTGNAADWVSTNDDGGDVYTVTLEFTISNPDSTKQDEVITFAKCAFETPADFGEGADYSTLVVSGKDFETAPTIEKAAASS